MTAIPKHQATPRKVTKKSPQPAAVVQPTATGVDEPIQYAGYDGLSEVAAQLKGIMDVLGAYHYNSTVGENSLNLFTRTNGHPVRLSLEGDAVDSIADSLKRIADAMTPGAGSNV